MTSYYNGGFVKKRIFLYFPPKAIQCPWDPLRGWVSSKMSNLDSWGLKEFIDTHIVGFCNKKWKFGTVWATKKIRPWPAFDSLEAVGGSSWGWTSAGTIRDQRWGKKELSKLKPKKATLISRLTTPAQDHRQHTFQCRKFMPSFYNANGVVMKWQ